MTRIAVRKTAKLYIGGSFVRTESGRYQAQQLAGAAGIVNVPGEHNTGEHGGYVVHVFPSCDFANETMTSIAPDLLAKVAEMEHMVIVIATVLDNKPDS